MFNIIIWIFLLCSQNLIRINANFIFLCKHIKWAIIYLPSLAAIHLIRLIGADSIIALNVLLRSFFLFVSSSSSLISARNTCASLFNRAFHVTLGPDIGSPTKLRKYIKHTNIISCVSFCAKASHFVYLFVGMFRELNVYSHKKGDFLFAFWWTCARTDRRCRFLLFINIDHTALWSSMPVACVSYTWSRAVNENNNKGFESKTKREREDS